ncbi:MAG: helix-turn-helix transcriptional regulator [Spirochaetota bacterium]
MDNGRFKELIELHKKIRLPEDFFSGTRPLLQPVPENILIFNRSDPQCFHLHDEYHYRFVLILNFRTRGVVFVDHKMHQLYPGYSLLIFPHQFHHYLKLSGRNPSWLFITFELKEIDFLLPLRNHTKKLDRNCITLIRLLTDSYLDTEKQGRNNRIVFFTASLLNEILHLENNTSPSKPSETIVPGVIQKINYFIYKNPGARLDEIASHAALSESHMRCLYRRHVGMSIGKYKQEIRINRARGFLGNSEMNISEIARECGYDSVYSFSRIFKKKMSCSPTEYRQKMRLRKL